MKYIVSVLATANIFLTRNIFFSVVTLSQVLDYSQKQPHELKLKSTLECCDGDKINNPQLLFSCTNESAFNLYYDSKSTKVAMVSYITPGILEYGAYAYSINTAYAEHNNYVCLMFSPETGHEFEPYDQRWNKVKIVLDMIDPLSKLGRFFEYVVWFDADLVVLDFSFNLTSLIEQHPGAQMIFSRDPQIENGVVNSGFFIAKNSDWSRDFLSKWWSTYDRVKGMDQHVFTRLWEQLQPDIANHVVLLRPDAINSNFPAWRKQLPHNQVLHLAGASTLLRKSAFKAGFHEVCRAATACNHDNRSSESSPLLPQLGLTRQELQRMEEGLPRREIMSQVLLEMKSKSSKHLPLREINGVRVSLREAQFLS